MLDEDAPHVSHRLERSASADGRLNPPSECVDSSNEMTVVIFAKAVLEVCGARHHGPHLLGSFAADLVDPCR